LKHYLDLAKFRITFFVGLSAMLGYILAGGELSEMFLPVLGVFLIASGSSALNQLQEVRTDSLMNRTAQRPLPKGRISPRNAMIFILIVSISGLLILASTGLFSVITLGLISIIWYNAVYTPLKRKTALAVFPGALLGALPPAIGWTAAGGSLMSHSLWAVALFLFIWQIPHFWFLFVIYSDDYQKAGFPTLKDVFSDTQLRRISFSWIVSLTATGFLLPLFINDISIWSAILLLMLGAVLLWRTKNLLLDYYTESRAIERIAFNSLNFYVLSVVLLLSIDKLINY